MVLMKRMRPMVSNDLRPFLFIAVEWRLVLTVLVDGGL